MDDINVNLSRNIVFLRKNGKLTQLELGKMLNVSDKAISRWERGDALPDISNLVDISTLFSVSVDSLLKDNLQQTIYKTIIPRNIRLAEAPSHGLPINLYDPKSAGAESYMLLAEEVINKGEE